MFTLRSKTSSAIDLTEATIAHLDFLNEVDALSYLYRGPLLANAIRRYEHFWLPLAANENTTQIAAPLDVEWVWYLHMLSPRVYDSDCRSLVSKIIDHRIFPKEQKHVALQKSTEIWKRLYPDEPFDVNPGVVSQISAAPSSELSCDLVRAAAVQRNFNYQVSLPHYYDRKFLGSAVKRYRKFLHLHASSSNEIFIPTCDIDLVWHAHLAHPLAYRNECSKLFQGTLDHDHEDHSPRVDAASLCAAAVTKERWATVHGDNYVLTGTTARREPPELQTTMCADAWKNLAAPIYTLNLVKVEVSDFPTENTYRLSINQNCGVEQTVTMVTGSSSCACDEGLVTFTSAAVSTDAPLMLTVKVTLADTSKANSVPLLFFPESLEAVLKENDFTRPKVSKRDFKIIPPLGDSAGKVSLTFQIMPPQRTGNYSLHVNQFDNVIELPDLASGVACPRSVAPPFMGDGPCAVTLYGVNSYSERAVFRCRIVEPTTSLLLALEVSDLTGQIVASCHSMAKGELPFKGQLSKRLSGFPYTKTGYEPKLLVRGRKDWGICYARATLGSRVKLYVYHLASSKRVEIEQPSKTSYRFKLGSSAEYINVDTMTGDIIIPRDVNEVPEILALCFSLRTLKQFRSRHEIEYVIVDSRPPRHRGNGTLVR